MVPGGLGVTVLALTRPRGGQAQGPPHCSSSFRTHQSGGLAEYREDEKVICLRPRNGSGAACFWAGGWQMAVARCQCRIRERCWAIRVACAGAAVPPASDRPSVGSSCRAGPCRDLSLPALDRVSSSCSCLAMTYLVLTINPGQSNWSAGTTWLCWFDGAGGSC
jgi:hypothetical protein